MPARWTLARSWADPVIARNRRRIVLNEEASVIPGPCLDSETIAAWADDSLTAGERAAAEAHAADCARCQAVLAAMVRMAAAPPSAAWWRRGSTLGLLVPLSAASATVI